MPIDDALRETKFQSLDSEGYDDVLLLAPSEPLKSGATVLASSIANMQIFEEFLNESKPAAFLNYYIEQISGRVTSRGGIMDSCRNDEVILLFGSPITRERRLFCDGLGADFR